MYSCGPTVYADQHIGNMRSYVFADTVKRALRWKGYRVRHVVNITDVGHLTSDADEGEDKMKVAAQREGRDVWEIARRYTERNGPKVFEVNARFGDPEAQAYLPKLECDLLELIEASLVGSLSQVRIAWNDLHVVCVVLASSGYPNSYETGHEICGLDEVAALPRTKVFHAATRAEGANPPHRWRPGTGRDGVGPRPPCSSGRRLPRCGTCLVRQQIPQNRHRCQSDCVTASTEPDAK